MATLQGRQSVPKPLDNLPYQRPLALGKKYHESFEDQVRDFVTTAVGAKKLAIVLGQIQGAAIGSSAQPVVLPVKGEAILAQGPLHEFCEGVSPLSFERLLQRLRTESERLAQSPERERRWLSIQTTSVRKRVPWNLPGGKQPLVVLCPGSVLHYKIEASPWLEDAASDQVEVEEHTFVFLKKAADKDAPELAWCCTMRQPCSDEALKLPRVELSVSTPFLWLQHERMRTGKSHFFDMIVISLLRNARSLIGFFLGAEQDVPADVFYPGLLENSMTVGDHYNSITSQVRGDSHRTVTQRDATANIRRYNNLMKVLLIEQFIDTMPGKSLQVLDIGCGRGQDVQKYSQGFRGKRLQKYVGVDIAADAVREAQSRYEELARWGAGGPRNEYDGHFFAGNVLEPRALDDVARAGHNQFDIACLHLSLTYLAQSEESVRSIFTQLSRMMQLGGRVIGTVPSWSIIEEHLLEAEQAEPAQKKIKVDADSATGAIWEAGNSFYKINFEVDKWQTVRHSMKMEAAGLDAESDLATKWGLSYTFTLHGAVEGQLEYVLPWDAFEALVCELGFEVLMDASFPETLDAYAQQSPYFNKIFRKQAEHRELVEEEEEVFRLYRCFVLEKVRTG